MANDLAPATHRSLTISDKDISFAPAYMTIQTEESLIRLSGDDIIEAIRDNRNDFIKHILDEKKLREFLATNYELKDVSVVKLEFIKRALKELVAAPVDLVHYATLILEIRKAGSTMISKKHESIFQQDVEAAIKGYI